MFGFGQTGFSMLGQALDSLSQIVAPEEGEHGQSRATPYQEEQDDTDDQEDDDFDSKMRKFILSRAQEQEEEQEQDINEAPSPASSFVSVALDDDSVHATPPPRLRSRSSPQTVDFDRLHSSDPQSVSPVQDNNSNDMDEARERDRLRAALDDSEAKYRRLQSESADTIAILREECSQWRARSVALEERQSSLAPLSAQRSTEDEKLIAEQQVEFRRLSERLTTSEEETARLLVTNGQLSALLIEMERSSNEKEDSIRGELVRLQKDLSDAEAVNIELRTAMQVQNAEAENWKSDQLTRESERLVKEKEEREAYEQSLTGLRQEIQQLQHALSEQQLSVASQQKAQQQCFADERLRWTHLQTELERTVDSAQAELSSGRKECTMLKERLQLAEAQVQQWKQRAEESSLHHDSHGDNQLQSILKLQSECDRLHLELSNCSGELVAAQSEAVRLGEALLNSENSLKEAEEIAWKNKVEASELLYAYQLEQESLKATNAALEAVRSELDQRTAQPAMDWQALVIAELQSLLSEESENLSGHHDVISTNAELVALLDDIGVYLRSSREMQSQLRPVQQLLQENGYAVNNHDLADATKRSIVEEVSVLINRSQEYRVLVDQLQSNLQRVLALDESKEEKLRQNEANEQLVQHQLSDLKTKCNADVQEWENERKQSKQQLQASQDQIRELKQQLLKTENDAKNFQVIISQLRSQGKAKSGEAESVQQEAAQLKASIVALSRENDDLRSQLRRFEGFDALICERDRLLVENSQYLTMVSDLRLTQSLLEKDLYGKTTAKDILQSEIKILKQDLVHRSEEVDNLQAVMEQLQSDHKFEISHFKNVIQDLQTKQKETSELNERQIATALELAQLRESQMQLTQQLEDQTLLRRQAELSFNQEKHRLQLAVETLMKQLNNSSHDVVDRMLISNLIVSYFQRRRSLEVLQLIARVLCFTDEQLVIVGLKVPPMNFLTNLVSSVFKPAEPVPVEGDNLAEMWVDFLIKQAGDDAPLSSSKSAKPNSS